MPDSPNSSGLIQIGLPLTPAIDFLRLFWAIDHGLQRQSKIMAASLGLTGPQRLLIRIIGRFPGVHAKQLAQILHLHPSSLTSLVHRLERRGLIQRRPDGRDRRRWLLGLTARGQALNRETPGTIEGAVQEMLATVPKRDLDGARVVLTALAHTLASCRPERSRKAAGA